MVLFFLSISRHPLRNYKAILLNSQKKKLVIVLKNNDKISRHLYLANVTTKTNSSRRDIGKSKEKHITSRRSDEHRGRHLRSSLKMKLLLWSYKDEGFDMRKKIITSFFK
jgi:hypothetical protein